jgi:hypothetical protein
VKSQKFKKIFIGASFFSEAAKLDLLGEKMSEFIWYWTKGNSKVYTRNVEVAEKAMKDGIFVMGTRVKPSIHKYR